MQLDYVLKKLSFDLLTPTPGSGGGVGRGLGAKYLLPCCCICDSLKFDMQHDCVLKKKMNLHLFTQPLSLPRGWDTGLI